ncbi:MAG TPA: hypothetical protein VD731_02475 [Nitrosopumilaceae archaeon]|nr:hypothetical protein [Nitrosopumilaceae archaeon]
MNCRRCHHTDQTHKQSDENISLLRLGSCQIPHCTCKQYLDAIKEIDEELL